MIPSALVISAAGTPAPEQLVPMMPTIAGSETSARAAAVPPSAEQSPSWPLISTSWPAISGRICCATSTPYWLSVPSASFAPEITKIVPMTMGSPSGISTHPNSSASQAAVGSSPPAGCDAAGWLSPVVGSSEGELPPVLLHAARASSTTMSTALQRRFLCIKGSFSSIARNARASRGWARCRAS